jgi:hypothetical protein
MQKSGRSPSDRDITSAAVAGIIGRLDDRGRWISRYQGQPLVGQPKFADGESFLSSAVFSHNLSILAKFLSADVADDTARR